MENLFYWAGMLAVAVNALTGVLDAGRKNMDLIGVVMVGAATALGGGTLEPLDAAVFDLPTALYVSGVEIEGSSVIGGFGNSSSSSNIGVVATSPTTAAKGFNLGLVDGTVTLLEAARRACLGAGAKVVGSYGFEIDNEVVREIESARCDIVLLCGGTDGGNSDFIISNASALAKSSGSTAVPSFSDVTQNRWLLGSLKTKYPSRYPTVTAPGKSGSVIWPNTPVLAL